MRPGERTAARRAAALQRTAETAIVARMTATDAARRDAVQACVAELRSDRAERPQAKGAPAR